MNHLLQNKITHSGQLVTNIMVALVELINRYTVAMVFLTSGWLKLQNWRTTEYLFEYEYQVPLLPWQLAMYFGTAAEMVLPLLLIAGLASRFSAASLFLVNLVAYISYAHVLNERPIAGLDHQLWALMLLIAAVRGGGLLSLDQLWVWWQNKRLTMAVK
ncbi:DoxX family protein [Salinibius halmophilus]|uniref:DoxX family protein n=1 Tax=Salinibius halmophilus TaxID=1853216 RepID=UPI000E672BE8|nr:DoxX family protein [Salinibius halmophilus]